MNFFSQDRQLYYAILQFYQTGNILFSQDVKFYQENKRFDNSYDADSTLWLRILQSKYEMNNKLLWLYSLVCTIFENHSTQEYINDESKLYALSHQIIDDCIKSCATLNLEMIKILEHILLALPNEK